MDAKDRLIIALDVAEAREALLLVDALGDAVSFYKVGLELYTATGPKLLRELVRRDLRVFLDLKFYDVAETVKRAVKQAAALGVSFLTIHGNKETLRAAVEGKGDAALKLLAVTVLTNLDEADLRDMGFPCAVEELVAHRASSAVETGCDGVIASGREAARIRALSSDLLIVTPGIRPSGTAVDEQKRSVTPAEAIGAGADYLVVGRPIHRAADPRAAAIAITNEMRIAFESRVGSRPAGSTV